ncbi:MAG: DUF4164 domain-containing protein [Lentilitoribacter sp.]
MKPDDVTVKTALDQLVNAVNSLENAVGQRIENQKDAVQSSEELKSMLVDRSRLAEELDQAEHRANKLEEANREVSRRLVTAMETIRAVLDRG